MKKLLLAIMFGLVATTAYAGCGIIEFKGTKPIFLRVDRISSVQYTGRYLIVKGEFGMVQFALKPNEAVNTYKRFRKRIAQCSK